MESASNYSSGNTATLTRYGFDVVKVRQSGGSTEFVTEAAVSAKAFTIDALLNLPHDLTGVLVVQYQAAPFGNFIDYEAFFRSALMLHDDILEPVLVRLKDRVESIHVLLGEMETWLLESQRKIEFIESTFGIKLEAPSAGDLHVQEVSACNGVHYHPGNLRCLRCNSCFEDHSKDSSGGYSCPYPYSRTGGKFWCKKTVPKSHVLKKYNDTGKFEKTFQITTENDQTKLKKCLEYMDA